ncbi:MAG: threonine ammonia-lyase [Gammaproteobacteria bacterium]|nr:threonine ammonia-lyase [Gammaproteobacteria bacterium]
MNIRIADIETARQRIADQVATTPFKPSRTLTAVTGADINIKFENQQFTASFKERGALNRLLHLSDAQRKRGVIAMSAGNHAQAVAYHGARLGIPTHIVMPRTTPNAKVEQTRVFGAEITLHGSDFDATTAFTVALARKRKLTLVHPYDDPIVVAGQGTLGLEMLEQIPDLDTLVVPIGGGGLISGVAMAAKSVRPDVRVIGVQAQRYSGVYDALHGRETQHATPGTVAEGIAIKSPSRLTLEMIREWVDDVVTVSEDQIENAIFVLLEVEKTVAEGAGAAALAAVMADPGRFAKAGKVGLVLSGGNIDMMILSSVLQRGLVNTHRLVKLTVEISDVPGSLAALTTILGELDSNIVDIVHQRTFGGSSARATLVELVLQMRGEEQGGEVMAALAEQGYSATLVD